MASLCLSFPSHTLSIETVSSLGQEAVFQCVGAPDCGWSLQVLISHSGLPKSGFRLLNLLILASRHPLASEQQEAGVKSQAPGHTLVGSQM